MQLFKNKKNQASAAITNTVATRPFIKRIGREPYTDWVIVIIVSVALAIILISMSLLKYADLGKIYQDQAPVIKPSASTLANTEILDDVIEDFGLRANLKDELRKGYFGPGDPSI